MLKPTGPEFTQLVKNGTTSRRAKRAKFIKRQNGKPGRSAEMVKRPPFAQPNEPPCAKIVLRLAKADWRNYTLVIARYFCPADIIW